MKTALLLLVTAFLVTACNQSNDADRTDTTSGTVVSEGSGTAIDTNTPNVTTPTTTSGEAGLNSSGGTSTGTGASGTTGANDNTTGTASPGTGAGTGSTSATSGTGAGAGAAGQGAQTGSGAGTAPGTTPNSSNP